MARHNALTPASIAARKGTHSTDSRRRRSPGTAAAPGANPRDISMTGKMFRRGQRAIVLHAANKFRHEFADAFGIFTVRADIDDRIVRD